MVNCVLSYTSNFASPGSCSLDATGTTASTTAAFGYSTDTSSYLYGKKLYSTTVATAVNT